MMLHAAMRWPEEELTPDLWPMAMDYAVYIYNRLPKSDTGYSPIELWSRTSFDFHSLIRDCHVWGAPSYTLEPSLSKAGGKLPKWQPRSRKGIFMGFSPDHSTLVGLVLNLWTKSITDQYHTVIDDNFTTVSTPEDDPDPQAWVDLLTCRNACVQVPFYSENDPATKYDQDDPIPSLSDEWLTSDELATRNALSRQNIVNTERLQEISRQDTANDERGNTSESETQPMHANDSVQVTMTPEEDVEQLQPPAAPNWDREVEQPEPPPAPNWDRARLSGRTVAVNDSAEANRSRQVTFQETPSETPSQPTPATNENPSSLRPRRNRKPPKHFDPGDMGPAKNWIDVGM